MNPDDLDTKFRNELKSKTEVPEKFYKDLDKTLSKIKEERKMKKSNKWITSIAAICILALLSGTGYAAITGKLKIFNNNKIDEQYDNYAEIVEDKFVENDYSKITLKEIACDDSYLILSYIVDVKEPGLYLLDDIQDDELLGFDFCLISDVMVNGKLCNSYSLNKQTAHKISNNQIEVYCLISLMGQELSDEFDVSIENFEWRSSNVSVNYHVEHSSKTIINDAISLKVSKSDAMANSTSFVPENSIYKYNDVTLIVEKIYKTPFESFVMVELQEANYSSDRFSENREDAYSLINLMILDENNNEISANLNQYGYVVLENGEYLESDGEIVDFTRSHPSTEFENATAVTKMIITFEEGLDNTKAITIKPYYETFLDNGAFEKEYFDSLTWYPVQEGTYSAENESGGKLEISQVEISEDKILFYYTKSGSVAYLDGKIYIRNKTRAFNYFLPDITNIIDENGNHICGFNLKDNGSYCLSSLEEGDTDDDYLTYKYSKDAFLENIEELEFAIGLGDEAHQEILGEGLLVELQ